MEDVHLAHHVHWLMHKPCKIHGHIFGRKDTDQHCLQRQAGVKLMINGKAKQGLLLDLSHSGKFIF